MDITQRKTGIEQRSDNTYVRKPKIVEEIPFNFGTVFKDKDGDWLSSTQGRVYKDKFGKIYTAAQYEDYIKNGTDEISRFDGRTLVRGLSGADPVGQFIVENAVLNKPVSYVAGRTFNALRQVLVPSNRAAHVYVNVSPNSYYGHTAEIKGAVKDMLKGHKADISKPKWKIKDSYKDSYLPQYDEEVANNIGNAFRDAAWKKYLGVSDGGPYYVKNKNGTWSYSLDEIEKLTKNGLDFGGRFEPTETSIVSGDFLTSAGGNLSLKVEKVNQSAGGIGNMKRYTFKDRWNLHPFSRDGGTISKRVGRSIGLLKDNESVNEATGNFVRNKLGNYIKPLKKVPDPKLKVIEKIDNFGRNFEIGKVLGGKPFDMETKVYTRSVIKKPRSKDSSLPFSLEDEPVRDMIINDYLDYDMPHYNINNNIKDLINNKLYTTKEPPIGKQNM